MTSLTVPRPVSVGLPVRALYISCLVLTEHFMSLMMTLVFFIILLNDQAMTAT